MQLSSIIDLTTEPFSLRFTKFRSFEETEKFIKCAGSVTLDNLNLKMLQRIDFDNFEMQLIDLQSSSI